MIATIPFKNKQLTIKRGLTKAQIQQLINFAQTDALVRKFTSDQDRFKNKAAYNQWREKDRTIYSLVDNQDNLVGIIWFGEKELPKNSKYKVTFAVRLYPPVRGRGLAATFVRTIFSHHFATDEYKKLNSRGVWLETVRTNERAVHLYDKLGFVQITLPDERDKVYMIYS